jgi:hypothetical protein
MNGDNLLANSSRARQWWLSLATIVFLVGIVYVAVYQRPYPAAAGQDAPAAAFSSARALTHLRLMATTPHPTGTRENAEVASYIQHQLIAAGLEPEVQEADFTDVRDGSYRVTHVRNIAAVKKGYSNSKPILLVAHYDTVITSAGASDDGAAVACLLETLRALKASPELKNDVVFLFTDGEELGIVGSRAFVAGHPWARDLGAVLNFEARGTGGPSILFETINGDGWLINEFVNAAPHPYGNSLLPTLFKFMPNDSDLSAFKSTTVPGLNFAFAEKWSHYHTRLDSLDSLDERSLQHHGEYALGLTRRLGDINLANPPKGNAVFFNLVGGIIAHYPAAWVPALSLLVALCLLAALIVGFRKKRLTLPGFLLGFAALPVAMILAAVVTALCARFAGRASAEGVAFFENELYYGGIVCLGLAVAVAFYALLARKTKIENLHLGAMVWWLALTVASTLFVPEASYLFVWPLLVGAALSLYLMLRPGDGELVQMGALWLGACVVLLVMAPAIYLMLLALIGPMGFVVTALVVLTAALLLPLSRFLTPHRVAWLPALFGAAGVLMFALAMIEARPGPAYPKEDQVFYMANLDQGKTIWATLEQREDAWTSQFFANQGSVSELSKFMPDYLYGNPPMLQRPAPVIELAQPTVSVLKDETLDNDRRQLRLSVNTARQSPELFVFVESDAKVELPELDGALTDRDRAQLPTSNNADGGAPGTPQVSVKYSGLTGDGASLLLETRKGASVKLHVVERSYDLPKIPGFDVKPRGAEFETLRSLGDGTIAYRSFTF